jgi:hypothetical protein
VREFSNALANRSLSVADRTQAVQRFLGSMRSATQFDLARVRPLLTYDFFRRDLAEEEQIREKMFEVFDRTLRNR